MVAAVLLGTLDTKGPEHAAGRTGITSLRSGGAIPERNDIRRVLGHTTGVGGFFGVSSMDRRPTEVASTQIDRSFKQVSHAATATS